MTHYVASVWRDGQGHRRRVRILIVPLDDDLIRRLERLVGQEVEVVVENTQIRCRVTRKDGTAALRPIEADRRKILRILRRGRRFVRVALQ